MLGGRLAHLGVNRQDLDAYVNDPAAGRGM